MEGKKEHSKKNFKRKGWVPLNITFVEYQKGDSLGLFFALMSLGPFVVEISYFVLIAFRRDLHTIFFFLGFTINEPLNYFLKRLIKEPRPIHSISDYGKFGMPSSHSQHSGFFLFYSVFFIMYRMGISSTTEKFVLSTFLTLIAILVSYGRVYLEYHTKKQVLVGFLLGAIIGILWFTLVHNIFSPYIFPSIVEWEVSKFFYIKDLTNVPNVLSFEYNCSANYFLK